MPAGMDLACVQYIVLHDSIITSHPILSIIKILRGTGQLRLITAVGNTARPQSATRTLLALIQEVITDF